MTFFPLCLQILSLLSLHLSLIILHAIPDNILLLILSNTSLAYFVYYCFNLFAKVLDSDSFIYHS